jgi:PAS domain S-box-containing protein
MASEPQLPAPRSDSDTDLIVALQARNAELERQLQQCMLELQQERETRQRSEFSFNNLQHLQAILHNSPISIFVKDLEGRYLMANPAFERFMGYQQAELLGKTDYDILPTEIGHRCWETDQMALHAQHAISFEERVPGVNGESVLQVTKFTIAGVEGHPSAICGITIDITEQKQAEAALQRQAQQEQALNRVVQAIHNSLDLQTIFSTATAEIAQLLGVERTTIMHYLPERQCWQRLAVFEQGTATQHLLEFEIPDQDNPFATRLKQLEVVQVDLEHPIADPINQEIAKTVPLPWLLVPIAVNQFIWGNLSLHRKPQTLLWQDEEIELARRIANQLAIAIQQANLYQQAQIELAERQRAEATLQQMNENLELIVQERTHALAASEATLRQQEQEFRTLVENIPDFIIRFDLNLRYLYVSPSLAAAMGIPVAAFIGKTIVEMGYPEPLVTLWIETKQKVLEIKQKQIIEFSVELAEGLRYLQSWNVPELDQDGNPESILVVVRDITDLKQTEEALRQSEELLRIALDAARMGAWHVNLLTGKETWSNRSQELFGLVPGTFDGSKETFLSLIHPDDRDRIEQTAPQALETGTREMEYRVVLQDQTIRWIASRGKVFFDQTGNAVQISGIDMEISDRKQAEQALQDSEEKFRQLAENIESVFWMTDAQDRLMYVSPSYEKVWRRSAQNLNKQNAWLKTIHPDDLADALKATEVKFEQGGFDIYYRIICPDGDVRWIHDRAFPVRNEQGDVIRFVGIADDITEQKQTEAALRQSETRFQRLVANLPGLIYQYTLYGDDSRAFTYVSPYCREMYEVEPEAAQQIPDLLLSMTHPADAAMLREARIASVETLQPISLEFRIVPPSGAVKWLQIKSQPERQSNGDVVWDGIALDITDRKRAEAEILRTRNLFEAVFNQSADAIFLVELPASRIRNCNQRAVDLFQADCREDLIGIQGAALHATPAEAEDLASIRETLSKVSHVKREIEYRTFQGRTFWGSLAANLIQVGNYQMALVRITDISEAKQREAERKQAEDQLITSLQEKEILFKEIHHRVKNNLQIISSLLRMQSRQTEDQQTVILFQEAQNRVQSMALIHEQLYQSPNLSQINFGQYLRTLVQNLFRSYGAYQQQITLTIEAEDLQFTLNSAIPCGLMINELVSNTLKYAFPNQQPGEVKICLQQDFSASEAPVTLTIKDNGIGISEQINWETTDSLGLRIVRNLVTQLKGTLTLDRSQGTLFRITFPSPLPIKSPDQR